MLTGRNALQHFRAQITGQAILVCPNNAMVMANVNHQGASGRTKGRQGTALSAVYIPRGENVAADASLGGGLSQQYGSLPLTLVGQVALSVDDRLPSLPVM